MQNWTTLPLFKQNVFLEQVVSENHYLFPILFFLASRLCCEFLRMLLPFNIQLSWPLDFFVVTQGPEQGILFYTGISIKYQSLFGMILKLLFQ